jgi:hypothetical protein
VKIKFQAFLTSALDGSKVSASRSGTFKPGEITPLWEYNGETMALL